MEENIEGTLLDIEISDERSELLKSRMTCWNNVSKLIYKSGLTEFEALELLHTECSYYRRPYVIHRIRGRLNAIRKDRELKEIHLFMKIGRAK